MTPLTITPSKTRAGFYSTVIPTGARQLLALLRQTPGCGVFAGVWRIPCDRADYIRREAVALGFEVRWGAFPDNKPISIAQPPNAKLYEYQKSAVLKALNDRRLMLNFKPGLGKTPTAIETLKLAKASRILIVCPAIVRDTWAQELATWWSKAAHEAHIIETGKEAIETQAPIVISSYELMGKLPPREWDAIVFDECHYLKTFDSKRSKDARRLLASVSKDTLRLFLTGTPIANEPIDLHNQVDLLYPDLFGTAAEFKRRYCNARENPHSQSGLEFFGLNKDNADELRERVGYFSVSATEEEVGHLLPPITFQAVRVKPERAFNVREYLDNFDRRDLHASKGSDAAIRACGMAKVDKTVELVKDALEGGSTHVAVMTHLRMTAQELADALAGLGVEVACVTGDDSHKARHATIDRLAKAPRAVFVGTMHSIGIGINELVAFPDVVYAELDYRPDEVAQSMKRYRRLTGKKRVRIRVLVLEGTLEERVARSVARKLKDQDLVVDIGTDAGALLSELDGKMTDDEFFAACQKAAAGMGERDVYA